MALYYWAGGAKRALEVATDRVAIDARAADKASLGAAASSAPVLSTLPGGLSIVEKSAVTAGAMAKLAAAHAARPVYRSGPNLVVLLPEVRVELDDGAQHAAAMQVIERAGAAAWVTDDTPERITLTVPSGDGEEALALANRIYEQAKPGASTARMVQVVARPNPRK